MLRPEKCQYTPNFVFSTMQIPIFTYLHTSIYVIFPLFKTCPRNYNIIHFSLKKHFDWQHNCRKNEHHNSFSGILIVLNLLLQHIFSTKPGVAPVLLHGGRYCWCYLSADTKPTAPISYTLKKSFKFVLKPRCITPPARW